jgi:hypothetical protein
MQRTTMHKRAKELISKLSLQPHPEGGHFREIFRSLHKVQRLDERSERSALTTIYFCSLRASMGAGTGSRPMRPGTSTKEIHLEVYWIDGRNVVHQAPKHLRSY